MIRYTVHFSGSVQGVGFRYTARRIANDYLIAGFVQNLPDGRVLLTVEGDQDQLDRLVADVRRQMRRYITDSSLDRSPASGEFGQPRPGGLFIRY